MRGIWLATALFVVSLPVATRACPNCVEALPDAPAADRPADALVTSTPRLKSAYSMTVIILAAPAILGITAGLAASRRPNRSDLLA